jgi:hypothetical protein
MEYALVVEVDNSGEDPDEGRRGLREELAPAVQQFPGFQSGMFLTNYDEGRGIGVVVFSTKEQALQIAGGFAVGRELRSGVKVTRTDVLEVSATA